MKTGLFHTRRRLFLTLSLCVLSGALPGIAQAAGRSTVTFRDTVGLERIYHFASGNNDHLVVNYWDGYTWHWADQGLPPGATKISAPSAITFKDFAGNQWIYVFAYASVGTQLKLVVNYWNGFEWYWANQGGDLASYYGDGPTPITYIDSAGHRRFYVFATGSNGHLVVNYWKGFVWQWADHGKPAGAFWVRPLDAVTYTDGSQRIFVFGSASGPQYLNSLRVNYWDGSAWHWLNLSGTGGDDVVQGSAITYFDGCEGRGCEGNQHIYLFSRGLYFTSSLWATHWDGHDWHSIDLGAPPGLSNIPGHLSAITYVDSAETRRIDVFVSQNGIGTYSNGVSGLYLKRWDGSGWHWADRGIPPVPGANHNLKVDAVTYVNSHGYRWVHAFCILDEFGDYSPYHLVRNSSVSGSFASWAYQGVVP